MYLTKNGGDNELRQRIFVNRSLLIDSVYSEATGSVKSSLFCRIVGHSELVSESYGC